MCTSNDITCTLPLCLVLSNVGKVQSHMESDFKMFISAFLCYVYIYTWTLLRAFPSPGRRFTLLLLWAFPSPRRRYFYYYISSVQIKSCGYFHFLFMVKTSIAKTQTGE